MLFQLINRMMSRGYRDCIGTNVFSAFNIFGRISDDVYLLAGPFWMQVLSSQVEGMQAQVIAMIAVVSKGSKSKVMIYADVTELDVSTSTHVPGEQGLMDLIVMMKMFQQVNLYKFQLWKLKKFLLNNLCIFHLLLVKIDQHYTLFICLEHYLVLSQQIIEYN